MKQVLYGSLLFSVLCLLFSGWAQETKKSYLLSLKIYRISENNKPSKFVFENLVEIFQDERKFENHDFILFSKAQLIFGDIELQVDEQGVKWKSNSPKDNPVVCLTSPKILNYEGELSEIKVTSSEEFQYMEKTKEGEFQLKKIWLETGIQIQAKITGKSYGVMISPLDISMSFVQEREKIPGVNLKIGKPILSKNKVHVEMKSKLDQNHGMLWRIQDGSLLIILRVSAFQNEAKGKKQDRKKIEALLNRLNSWHIDELIRYEESKTDPNITVSGESSAYVEDCKKQLIEFGVKVRWNGEKKQYEIVTEKVVVEEIVKKRKQKRKSN